MEAFCVNIKFKFYGVCVYVCVCSVCHSHKHTLVSTTSKYVSFVPTLCLFSTILIPNNRKTRKTNFKTNNMIDLFDGFNNVFIKSAI